MDEDIRWKQRFQNYVASSDIDPACYMLLGTSCNLGYLGQIIVLASVIR